MNRQNLLFILLSCFTSISFAQIEEILQAPMRVVHCSAVDQVQAVQNVFVDDNNIKWAATTDGLFRIHSADNSTKRSIDNTKWALLRQADGNFPLLTNSYDLEKLNAFQSFNTDKSQDRINTTYYNAKRKILWIGTTQSGIYRYKMGDDIRLLDHMTNKNSKLLSNHINSIFTDRYGRTWIATDQGVLVGEKDKWRLEEKETKFVGVIPDKVNIWLMGEDILYMIDEKYRWRPGDVDPRVAVGKVRDMKFDGDGRIWYASDIITRYDVVNDIVEKFDRSNGFTAKQINCIRVDQDNALWVGTEDKGLFLIEKEAAMTVTCFIDKDLSCAGMDDDASLLVKVLGGTPPYKYIWENNFSGPNPQNVGPGFYTVQVTDAEGQTKKVSANIPDNRMRVNIISEGKVSATGKGDGAAELSVTGGVPPYKFRWDNGETKAKARYLTAGRHEVTVNDNANCEYITAVQIEGEILTGSASTAITIVSPVTVAYSIDKALVCQGAKDAAISIQVKGGTPPYKYQWNEASLSGKSLSGLRAGKYSVSVIDAEGYTTVQTIYVEEPEPIKAIATMEQAVSGDRKRDGAAFVSASGGSGNYSYRWSNNTDKARAKKLVEGKYTVTVTDDNACEAVAKVDISKQINLALTKSNLRKGQTIRLEKLYFEADSTQMTTASFPTLNEIYTFLQNNPNITIEVGGHTNGVPSHEYCDNLSTERARSVAKYLVQKGVPVDRVKYRGYGKRKPIATNETTTGRKRNQRVEIKILEVGG